MHTLHQITEIERQHIKNLSMNLEGIVIHRKNLNGQ